MTQSRVSSRTEKLEQFALWLIAGALGLYFSGGILPPLLHLVGMNYPADMLLAGYSHTCHQMADRSFFLCGIEFGFCARCTGFYGGLFAGAIYTALRRNTTGPPRLLVLVFSLLTLVDVVFSLSPDNMTGNWLRMILGLPTGFLLAFWALAKLRARPRGTKRETLLEHDPAV